MPARAAATQTPGFAGTYVLGAPDAQTSHMLVVGDSVAAGVYTLALVFVGANEVLGFTPRSRFRRDVRAMAARLASTVDRVIPAGREDVRAICATPAILRTLLARLHVYARVMAEEDRRRLVRVAHARPDRVARLRRA